MEGDGHAQTNCHRRSAGAADGPARDGAGPLKGAAAFKRGDYVTALREWRPLAEMGNPAVQFSLGSL